MKKIKNIVELANVIVGGAKTVEEAKAGLSRSIYKNTDCGAWISFNDDGKGVKVGSIVEGVDQCAESQDLDFPFTKKEFDEALEAVEKSARDIWNKTHGCDDCGDEDEFGNRAINPKCKTCNGNGVIL